MKTNTLKIKVNPEWENISAVREQCDEFLQNFSYSEEFRYTLCMITSELLENAIKYGAFKEHNQDHIPFSLEVNHDKVLIEVQSPLQIENIEDNMRRLDTVIQWIRSFQSPFQAYLERLKLLAGQPMYDEESGLGLIRIAYEGEAVIDFFVDEKDQLHISAIRPTNYGRN